MVLQLVERRLNLTLWKAGRLTQLLLLAISVLSYSVLAMAVANSLFISYAGAENLPFAFILIGLFSMPAYTAFSQIVDCYSRPQLFRYALLVSIALMLGLRLLLTLNALPVYYLLLIVIFFQWDFHNSILYPSLLTDYFTAIEYKRYAPFIGIAQAVGTLLGGGLTALLSHYLEPQDLLLCLPVIFAIAIFQLFYLENSHQRLDTVKVQEHVGIVEALKTFPDLANRYRLVLFLAASSFLLVIIYLSSEFLWFNVYAQRFTDRELTGFLGLIRVINSILQIVVLYCFTRPLLHGLGVARMNIMYPIATLFSLLGLAFNFNLKTAVILHLNGDSLYKSINLPVHQLNYNAIPREFIGRVRALSDGFIYASGLTLAGVILWVSQTFLNWVEIVWLVIALTLLLLLLRLPMGKLYARGLEAMIRSDTIDLDDFSDSVQLPPQSALAIRELLVNSDRYVQIKGLELAASMGHPSQFFSDVKALLPSPDADIRRAIIKLFNTAPDPETISQFEELLSADAPALREVALEILIANQYCFGKLQLQTLVQDKNLEVRALAAVAKAQIGATEDLTIAAVWQSELAETTSQAIARAITYSNNRQLAPLLKSVVAQDNPKLKREGLKALAALTQSGDLEFAKIAVEQLHHSDPLVRANAFHLLGTAHCLEMLSHVVAGLDDRDPRVRQQVAGALAAYGNAGLSEAQKHLSSVNLEVVQTAILSIGQVGTKRASNLLFDYLAPDYQHVIHTRRWQQQIPRNDAHWQALKMAIADYHQRLIQKVLYVLSCLGHSRTVNTVNRLLNTTNQHDLANAVEVLASLSDRRFVLPLMPILEQLANQELPTSRSQANLQWLRSKGYKLLLEALESKDRWIRIGALVALAGVPSAAQKDPDPLVRTVAQELFPPDDRHASSYMNRLLLLKNIALFKNLSLDELLLIDKALEQKQVLAGETIFSEGSWDTYFYIIAAGSVRIVKTIDGEQRELHELSVGQHFGEVALFDDAPRWDGAIAAQDCTLLKLDKNRFISLIAQRPHIILEVCRFLSQRLRETDKYLASGKLLPPTEISW